MKVKEFATQAGITHQAIYKRLKKRGISLESLTDKETGELTEEGLSLLIELYPQGKDEKNSTDSTPVAQPLATSDEVARLNEELHRLRNQLRNSEEKVAALTDERDYLRKLLDHSQEMEGLRARLDVLEAGQKAARAKALTDGSEDKGQRRGPLSWLRGRKERKSE